MWEVQFPTAPSFDSQPGYFNEAIKQQVDSTLQIDTAYTAFFWNKFFHAYGWFPLVFPPEPGVEFYTLNLERSFKSTIGFTYNLNEGILQTKISGSYAKLFPVITGGFILQGRKLPEPGLDYDPENITERPAKERILTGGVELPLRLTQGVYFTNLLLRACLEVVLWQRKWLILGSHEAIFELHSGAMGRKNGKVRFQKRSFAAQMTTSKHALKGEFNHYTVEPTGASENQYRFGAMKYTVGFSNLKPQARRQVQPRFGQILSLEYQDGAKANAPRQLLANARLYFPGLFKTHSLNFRGAYEQNENTGNYRYLSSFQSSRGYAYYPFDESYLASINYELPVWYPDKYIRRLVGVSRVRVNAFYDYAWGKLLPGTNFNCLTAPS